MKVIVTMVVFKIMVFEMVVHDIWISIAVSEGFGSGDSTVREER